MDAEVKKLSGIHHITAISGNLQSNLDFYNSVLGLRLVKITVNFDDPSSYHLYYGDGIGQPGTILTFFIWPQAPAGRRGSEQITSLSFSIPQGATGFWIDRFRNLDISYEKLHRRLDDEVLTFYDPDNLKLELVASPLIDNRQGWPGGMISKDFCIKGIYKATLTEKSFEPTSQHMVDVLGMKPTGQFENGHVRFLMGDGAPGSIVDLEVVPELRRGLVAGGTIHHIAWRTSDSDSQRAWRTKIAQEGINITPARDRKYFQSIYFREPGGAIFEIATDGPGFTIDEPATQLGRKLMLPSWLEKQRAKIEGLLPPIKLGDVSRKV